MFSPLKTACLGPAEIEQAARILTGGGTVAFPTETVYGLGANALAPAAVEKIFAAKQRPHWDPLIVHMADLAQLPAIATASPLARRLMSEFWPGPLTLLLPRTLAIPDVVTAGRPLVGVRIPSHPVALALLRAAGIPIAAPSANTFGHTSPTTGAHVLADLDGRIDAVLDGGPTSVGLESTVVEVRGEEIIIYRPGAVTLAMIEAVTGHGTVRLFEPRTGAAPEALPSPGVGIRHYAPRARLLLVEGNPAGLAREPSPAQAVGVLLPEGWPAPPHATIFPWGSWNDHDVLARRLFDGLRSLDDRGVDLILCPVPEGPGLAEAIRDRLEKAARSA